MTQIESTKSTGLVCESEDLRSRALEGDPTLLNDLINCFQDDLIRFLQHRCGHTGDAEDATQDTFESAIRYLDGYRGESSLKSWLYRLASSACVKMRRGRKNDPKLHESLDVDKAERAKQLSQEIESMLEARLMPLEKAFGELGQTDRSVLLLRDGEELSIAEIAEKLDLTESATKSRLHRARKQVRILLNNE